MDILTVILFFIYSWGLGFTATYFVRNADNFLERNLMRIGIGIGVLPILGIFLSLIRIPLDWKVFLILSLIMPLFYFFKNLNRLTLKPKITKFDIYITIVLLMFLTTFYMYHKGAFAYPHLEDDDPWSHAIGIKFVSMEKTVFMQGDTAKRLQYISPYPPAYDFLFGILHQTSLSLVWTMKFFNALIISLSIVFFYFFVKKFTGNRNKALFATFILASIPCYLSHFIWAHSLIVILFFPAMYCIEMLREDKRWMYVSIIVIASICVTQPTQPIKFAILFGIYLFVKWVSSRKFDFTLLASLFGGYFLSLIWWFYNWKNYFHLARSVADTTKVARNVSFFAKIFSKLQQIFPPTSGTATRAYSFNEIVFAKHQNMINNPIGIGLFISLLLLTSVIFLIVNYKRLLDEKHNYLLITLLWAIFTFLGFSSMTFNLPFGFFGFRFWMLFAIPASILAVEGLWFLYLIGKNYGIPKIIILIIVVTGIIFTSAHQKFSVNTAIWPPGAFWTSMEELQGYIWLKNLPPNTKVFSFTNDAVIIGFDKFTCAWCDNVVEFKKTAINQTAEELHSWLKKNKYKYLTIGGQEAREFGDDIVNNKMQEIIDSNLFQLVHQTKRVVIFKIV